MAEEEWFPRRLEIIRHNLQEMKASYPEITRHYATWSKTRRLSLKNVADLQGKLNRVYAGARVASGAGSAVSVAGSVTSLTGVVLALTGCPAALPFLKVGSNMKIAGELTLAVTPLVEMGISSLYMRDVKRILENDKEASEPIIHWLDYTKKIDAVYRETFGCSMLSSAWNYVKAAWKTLLEALESGKVACVNMIEFMRNLLKGKLPGNAIEEVLCAIGRLIKRGFIGLKNVVAALLSEMLAIATSNFVVLSVKIFSTLYFAGMLGKGSRDALERCLYRWEKFDAKACGWLALGEVASILINLANMRASHDAYYHGISQHSARLEGIKQHLENELNQMEEFIMNFQS